MSNGLCNLLISCSKLAMILEFSKEPLFVGLPTTYRASRVLQRGQPHSQLTLARRSMMIYGLPLFLSRVQSLQLFAIVRGPVFHRPLYNDRGRQTFSKGGNLSDQWPLHVELWRFYVFNLFDHFPKLAIIWNRHLFCLFAGFSITTEGVNSATHIENGPLYVELWSFRVLHLFEHLFKACGRLRFVVGFLIPRGGVKSYPTAPVPSGTGPCT